MIAEENDRASRRSKEQGKRDHRIRNLALRQAVEYVDADLLRRGGNA